MSHKWFPIKTDTACQLKWTWSTILLGQGKTSSCHRVIGDQIDPDFFANFHNTPKKIQDRKTMLEGQWPQGGCEYCQQIEQVGGTSDRQNHLQIPDLVPPELDNDLTAVYVSPRILEVYFNNTCNLSCLYCWDGFSSKIEQENRKFGRFEKNGVVIDNRARSADQQKLTEEFWKWMHNNATTLRRLHILGGEPFYQTDFYRCLDFLENNPCPDLELNVISNLIVNTEKFQNVIDRIEQLIAKRCIKRFDLTASVDSFGPSQAYVRYGFDEQLWKSNFEYAVSCGWITLNINQTLTGLIVKEVPTLLHYVNQLRKSRPIGHYFSLPVFTHNFLHPKIFGGDFFKNDFHNIVMLMPLGSQQDYMNGIRLHLESTTKDVEGLKQLKTFLEEIDRRRNTNWRQAFPWLVEELNVV